MQLNDKAISRLYIIFSVALTVVALTVLVVFLRHPQHPVRLPVGSTPLPTDEERAYFPEIELANAHMSAADNFLGATITYLDAQVTNKGTKIVERLDLDLTFVDMVNQVVLRERAHPVTRRSPPLKPGEVRAIHVSFEQMPAEWNQAPPTMIPVYLEF